MRVIVTRPQPQAAAWVARLRAAGFDAVALPLIEIVPVPDRAAVESAWRSLAQRALVVFVSPGAVESFFDARPADTAWPDALPAGSVGPGTTQSLRAHGVPSVLEPPAASPRFDSEALWAQLESRDWRAARVLIVRGDGGREWLAERLRERGAEVELLAAYSRRAPPLDPALLRRAIESPQAHVWLFSSSQAIDHLEAALRAPADLSSGRAVATHPRIAERARRLGLGDVREARAGFDAVVQALHAIGAA